MSDKPESVKAWIVTVQHSDYEWDHCVLVAGFTSKAKAKAEAAKLKKLIHAAEEKAERLISLYNDKAGDDWDSDKIDRIKDRAYRSLPYGLSHVKSDHGYFSGCAVTRIPVTITPKENSDE